MNGQPSGDKSRGSRLDHGSILPVRRFDASVLRDLMICEWESEFVAHIYYHPEFTLEPAHSTSILEHCIYLTPNHEQHHHGRPESGSLQGKEISRAIRSEHEG